MQITMAAVKDWERDTGQKCWLRGLLYDPELNIEVGTWYLSAALVRWRGYRDAEILALAQYNAGARNAARWAPSDPADAMPLSRVSFPSTREYISRVRQYRRAFEREQRDRERHQTNLSTPDPASG
jgi:soluble lytic murein transglycosylase